MIRVGSRGETNTSHWEDSPCLVQHVAGLPLLKSLSSSALLDSYCVFCSRRCVRFVSPPTARSVRTISNNSSWQFTRTSRRTHPPTGCFLRVVLDMEQLPRSE